MWLRRVCLGEEQNWFELNPDPVGRACFHSHDAGVVVEYVIAGIGDAVQGFLHRKGFLEPVVLSNS
jgi:hypothetical protein